MTIDCLEVEHIEHYFIDAENLLDEKEISEEKLNEIKEYFRGKLIQYSL